MKHVHTFKDFLEESAGPYISPEVKIGQNIQKTMDNISVLKDDIIESPEKRVIIAAKLEVEMQKLNTIQAQKKLLSAKEFEEKRVEREKAQKLKDKADAAADKKMAAKKLKLQKK